jgi:putative transposase
MPRKPRLFVPGATYHVYCRVARGEFVFDEPNEVTEFVEIARQVRDLDGWKILAWCLMANHYHLVTTTGSVPLWRSMARLQRRVARGFNRRRGYLGRLWQSRYRARVIDSNDYFRQVISYVHLNPVEAGIVEDPADHPHSGHNEILGRREPRLIDVAGALVGFDAGPGLDAREGYLVWVRAVAEARWFSHGVDHLPWWKGASDEGEIASPDLHSGVRTFDGRTFDGDLRALELGDFVARFECCSDNSLEGLASPLRNPELIRGRIELAMVAVARYGFQSRVIADLVKKHPASVTRWLNEGLRMERDDPVFRERIAAITKLISTEDNDNATM